MDAKSATFLCDNNFDWQRCIKDGISYISRKTEEALLAKLDVQPEVLPATRTVSLGEIVREIFW